MQTTPIKAQNKRKRCDTDWRRCRHNAHTLDLNEQSDGRTDGRTEDLSKVTMNLDFTFAVE